MQTSRFNPFTDRLSRDIRNALSSTLMRCLAAGTVDPAREVAQGFLANKPLPFYVRYIEDRLERYEQATGIIGSAASDPIRQALVLWDLELFFEMHHVLELTWYHAEGEEKQLLQALIRAAGMYIKLEYGFIAQARKIAAKALPVLERQRHVIAAYFPPDILIEALRSLQPTPPKLLDRDPG